jgi:hypothetical protein
MSNHRTGLVQICIALVFAAAILISSFWLKDSDFAETSMFMLIAVWVTISGLVDRKSCSPKRKKTCQF